MAATRKDKRPDMEEIGARLEYLLKASHMSTKALATKSKVRPDAIGRLARAERLPELRGLKAIAAAFGVSAGWFTFGEGDIPKVALADPADRDQRRRDG